MLKCMYYSYISISVVFLFCFVFPIQYRLLISGEFQPLVWQIVPEHFVIKILSKVHCCLRAIYSGTPLKWHLDRKWSKTKQKIQGKCTAWILRLICLRQLGGWGGGGVPSAMCCYTLSVNCCHCKTVSVFVFQKTSVVGISILVHCFHLDLKGMVQCFFLPVVFMQMLTLCTDGSSQNCK